MAVEVDGEQHRGAGRVGQVDARLNLIDVIDAAVAIHVPLRIVEIDVLRARVGNAEALGLEVGARALRHVQRQVFLGRAPASW
jgi:hypothetical protein